MAHYSGHDKRTVIGALAYPGLTNANIVGGSAQTLLVVKIQPRQDVLRPKHVHIFIRMGLSMSGGLDWPADRTVEKHSIAVASTVLCRAFRDLKTNVSA
ncbi:hypothetical protein EW026_g5001 [Hermanssonia centrifuga]|uniref:Uncharacterized protein n=1 Tax=Hermanssonia centrifuga TaxID=98765 RepID=A0A4S4KJV9_9APHY|nr:hypothetical protein EW026_g5001 [Hermanssonia centrifuga]